MAGLMLNMKHGWFNMKAPPETWKRTRHVAAEEEKPTGDPDVEESDRGEAEARQYRRDWRALTESWDLKLHNARADKSNMDYVNRLPPMVRVGSMPGLESR